ncbi:hypothetical protein LINPERHAP1_LOCUS25249 [Linum perenne]
MYEGDAGSYHAWCPDDLVMLRRGNIGGAKLSVQKHGFSPPHYSDSSKIAYVIQACNSFVELGFNSIWGVQSAVGTRPNRHSVPGALLATAV